MILDLVLVALVSASPSPSPAASPEAAKDKAKPAAAEAKATPATPAAPAGPVVVFETSQGTIKAVLFKDRAPKTVENFLEYVRAGHYDGTIFHRVIPGFMIQGGGFDALMKEKATRAAIQNEARKDTRNRRGTLAMARLPQPHTATAQFFINLVDNDGLDFGVSPDGWGYAVFGEVVEGLDVVDRIARVETTNRGPHQNVPRVPVEIKSAREAKP